MCNQHQHHLFLPQLSFHGRVLRCCVHTLESLCVSVQVIYVNCSIFIKSLMLLSNRYGLWLNIISRLLTSTCLGVQSVNKHVSLILDFKEAKLINQLVHCNFYNLELEALLELLTSSKKQQQRKYLAFHLFQTKYVNLQQRLSKTTSVLLRKPSANA